jgi:CRISPR system Cascade subunit CasD
MTRWLVIYLDAPLASFGQEPGNVMRGSDQTPTRSALLGLAGAALGLKREDAGGQTALGQSLRTATRSLSNGEPLADFHTFQSLPATERNVTTRADALSRRDKLVTSITQRSYRMDGVWQAAYRLTPEAALTLEQLAEAFQSPRFVLYLGRKSCPLAHPMRPALIEAETVSDAFQRHMEQDLKLDWQPGGEIAVDHRDDLPAVNRARRRTRLDDPRDRLRWHFAGRPEWVFSHRPGDAP